MPRSAKDRGDRAGKGEPGGDGAGAGGGNGARPTRDSARTERGERGERAVRHAKHPDGAARPPADVHLGADWVARWVKELDPEELRLYVAVAREAGRRVYHDPAELAGEVAEPSADALERRVAALERRRLVEVVRRRGGLHFHLLCRGKDGVHRAEPQRPSIQSAIDFHQSMMQELLAVAAADEDQALRERTFERYPALRDEYVFSLENREDGAPEWKLWMELSLFLMNRFEERYGDLKAEHADVFKEVSAQLLRLKLEMIDGLTRQILERRGDVFKTRGEGWVAGLPESAFVALPLVRELSKKYRVGAEQIYLNAIEALQSEGLCVVELDAKGGATDLVLPSTTGLCDEEERLVFLHVEEMTTQEIERYEETLGRIRAAKEKYARFLLERGVRTIVDLVRADRVADIDALLQTVVDRVNESVDLVSEDGEDARVTPRRARLEDALQLYEERRGSTKAR